MRQQKIDKERAEGVVHCSKSDIDLLPIPLKSGACNIDKQIRFYKCTGQTDIEGLSRDGSCGTRSW